MPTRLRRRVRHVRRAVVYGVAALIVLAGLLVAVASQLLPLVEQRPRQLAEWLSERSGRPVAFQASQAEWTRRGPLFVLDGLTIGAGDGALDVGRAELLVDVYAGLLPGQPLTELRLRGVELEVSRDAAGRWQVAGMGAGSGGDGRLRQLEGLGEVQLENARVRVTDAVSGQEFSLDRVDARVLASGGRVRVGAVARRGEGAPLSLAAELDPGLSEGRAWVGGRDLVLQDWLGQLAWRGAALHGGGGELQLWLQLSDRRVVQAQLEAELQEVALRGLAPVLDGEATIEPRLGLDRLAVSARWRTLANGWELSVPTLELDDGGRHGGGEGLWLSRRTGGSGVVWQAQATDVQLATPIALATLTGMLPPAARRWLYLAAPHGVASDLRLLCGRSGCSAQAALAGVQWSRVGRIPGVDGLAGRIDLGGEAALFAPGDSTIVLDARSTFRAPLRFSLAGRVHALRDEGGWRIGSDALRIRGADFAATAAGDLLLEPGGRPRVDLFADVAGTSVTAASQFWTDRMPPRVVQWLDEALVSGRVTGGRAVLQGDLDDWPFRDNTGVFEAEAGIDGVVLDYRPGEWPRAEGLSGTVRFRNQGMEASASGTVAGVAVERVDGRIEDFKEPVLELEIAGAGSGPHLMALLRASPLQQRYGSHLLGVSVGGRAGLELDLVVPLKEELGEPRVLGSATLEDANLADAKWGLAFAGATGRVRFGSGGFAAEELRVRFGERPATLSLAVGDYASEPALAVEATLRGRMDADALLSHAPTLDWMAPYVDGVSDWQLLLLVPREDSDQQRVLRLASDLEGTALAFPAPLRKSAAARLPLQLEAQLPLEQGSVQLSLGELLSLRGSLPAGGGFTGVAAFGAAEPPDAPARGLRVVGSVPALDAAGWLAVAASRGSNTTAGSTGDVLIDSVDLRAGELDLAGRRFTDTRLQLSDHEGDTRIELVGPAVDGALLLPGRDAAQRGITARFERLHLPSATPTGSAAPGAAASLLAALHPKDLPSLHAWVGHLRVGEATLGETRLETWPTPEGMHVQLFEARSKALELRASGDWNRIDGRERSTFQIGFTAEELGAMLQALGFARMVEGGQTLARLDVTWPGAPSEFQLERLDGRLSLSVGQGSVPDVKPGAGRILGLLSLSEIPRRLSLDFSDFFTEGFSFNTITGDFVLDSGNAWTENLAIDAAAAQIRVRGRTGLADRTYDQTMEVVPRTSGVLPVVGAIAGGPAGAAIGAVAQAVLQRPMKDMARAVYRVQGSWDDPQIELVERGAAKQD